MGVLPQPFYTCFCIRVCVRVMIKTERLNSYLDHKNLKVKVKFHEQTFND